MRTLAKGSGGVLVWPGLLLLLLATEVGGSARQEPSNSSASTSRA
jgi:hypothetical protein